MQNSISFKVLGTICFEIASKKRLENLRYKLKKVRLIKVYWEKNSFRVDIPYSVDRIILGDLLLSSPSNHHLNITLAEIIPYPGYDTQTSDGDLALIRLSQPVDFTTFVGPACLAESSEEVKDYTRCTVSGWGNTEAGKHIMCRRFRWA